MKSHFLPFICNECQEFLETEELLKQHIEKNHPFSCKKCPRSFDKLSSLANHIKGHKDYPKEEILHQCDKCENMAFANKKGLILHMARVHANENKPEKEYPCEKCDLSYGSRSGIKFHYKTRHPGEKYIFKTKNKIEKNPNPKKKSEKESGGGQKKKYPCSKCGVDYR